MRASTIKAESTEPVFEENTTRRNGVLIVNADDWGRDCETTDRIADCIGRGAVSAVSAMVYMEDSERAAVLAREQGIDAGLHLNFTTPFSPNYSSSRLIDCQERIASYLQRNRLSRFVFHPGLSRSFAYVVEAQIDEYRRLYGSEPDRIDGHHHMHLCANVVLGNLMPEATLVRRNCSFAPGEKSWINRFYRRKLDERLSRRYRVVDYLFSLAPIEPANRLERIISVAQRFIVELETHPINPDEYQFLMQAENLSERTGVSIARTFTAK